MTGGRVQLATTGLQDVFLTGNPDVTYFNQVYKRHSRFSLETIDNVFFNKSVNFGDTLRGIVERRGDLIRNIYFRIELSEIVPSAIYYTDSIAHALIEYADLIIGGQVIERINGEYIKIFDEMFIDASQRSGVDILTGSTGTRTGLSTSPFPRTFFVNLPFYFRRNDSLSIPLCALTLQEVEVEIKLRPLNEIIVETTPTLPTTIIGRPNGSSITFTTASPTPVSAIILKATMPVEYVFLDDEEKNYYKNHVIEHTITQLQMYSDTIPTDESTITMRLPFINPVKELYMVIQNNSNVAPDQNDWFNYTNNGDPQLENLQLEFNNETFISPEIADDLFLRILQPMNRHTSVPSLYIYNYSFALDPENYRPTGQVNMSRIQNKLLTVNLRQGISQDRQIRVYAKSYNILRIENGLAGVLFIDNNHY
jgi:hypothetical protein